MSYLQDQFINTDMIRQQDLSFDSFTSKIKELYNQGEKQVVDAYNYVKKEVPKLTGDYKQLEAIFGKTQDLSFDEFVEKAKKAYDWGQANKQQVEDIYNFGKQEAPILQEDYE